MREPPASGPGDLRVTVFRKKDGPTSAESCITAAWWDYTRENGERFLWLEAADGEKIVLDRQAAGLLLKVIKEGRR